jgi:uncharacterized protein (TIGR02271 family)
VLGRTEYADLELHSGEATIERVLVNLIVERRGRRSSESWPATEHRPPRGARALALLPERQVALKKRSFRFTKRSFGSGSAKSDGGSVRVRSYVVEQPVQEQVHLWEERVHVERRPVDRPAYTLAGAAEPFRERTIEVTATAEEAVVAKEARVKEEIVVSKDTQERTETVSDTVRRTEVEVDDERATAPTRNPKP